MNTETTTFGNNLRLAANGKSTFWSKLLPISDWLPNYKKEYLSGDLLAGVIVTIMLVPQGMAYAMLAGLPPQVGLYASILPLLIYAVFGTSKTLAVGPVAMVSLLTLSGVGALAQPGSSEFIVLALTLALLVGVMQILMGIARLGFLVNFLSHPVLVGFTSAAALVIGFSQLKHLFGIKVPDANHPYELLLNVLKNISATNRTAFALGISSILILLYFNYFAKKNLLNLNLSENTAETLSKTGPLIAVLLTTLAVWLFGFDKTSGVKIVGEIPAGLPSLTMPITEMSKITALLPIAAVIALVGFMESNAIGTTLASRRRQKIEANQELFAIGAANVGAAFTGGYPVAGGLARSVVNFNSGANTQLSSVITALLMALTVVLFTPVFYYLPQATLASIVIVAVISLFDFKSFKRIWVYSKTDAVALLATFFGVMIFDIEVGIGIGIATALVLYLYRTSKPHVAVVGRVGDTEHYRNVLRHKVKTCPETLAVRIDESLYFANTKELEKCLLGAVADRPEIKNIVLICSAVNLIDASALETLERIIEDLKAAGVKLYLAEVKGPVTDRLEKVGFLEHFGRENIFLSTHQAMEHLGCK